MHVDCWPIICLFSCCGLCCLVHGIFSPPHSLYLSRSVIGTILWTFCEFVRARCTAAMRASLLALHWPAINFLLIVIICSWVLRRCVRRFFSHPILLSNTIPILRSSSCRLIAMKTDDIDLLMRFFVCISDANRWTIFFCSFSQYALDAFASTWLDANVLQPAIFCVVPASDGKSESRRHFRCRDFRFEVGRVFVERNVAAAICTCNTYRNILLDPNE